MGAERVRGQRFGQSASDLGLAVAGHQAMQLLDLAFEVDATTSHFLQVQAGLGCETGDAILAGDRAGPRALWAAICSMCAGSSMARRLSKQRSWRAISMLSAKTRTAESLARTITLLPTWAGGTE